MASNFALSTYIPSHSSDSEIFEFQSDSGEYAESLASLETDDGEDHPPEKIIADETDQTGQVWYLVKWKDCNILRSSWEGSNFCTNHPKVFKKWLVEKERILRGDIKALDLKQFKERVSELENQERQRRRLRRFKRRMQSLIDFEADK